MNQPTDDQIRILTVGIAASDREAFRHFFRLMYPRLVQYACKYTNDKPTAGDIVQDAFVILWEKRREADPQRSLKAFAYKIVRNRALNFIRDHSNTKLGLEMINHTRLKTVRKTDLLNNEDEQKLIELLELWVDNLPKRQQEAFRLSRFEGLDHNEIAEVMDISSNTVNNHIVAALQHLRNRYNAFQKEGKD